ncbi:Glycerol-3-phosphate 1-O-acyltransferase PlsY [Candidatus Hepatincolaceae symbiont of Richtersius coronifer]
MLIDLIYIIIISYFIGSFPYGWILVKVFKNADLKTIGSKSTGVTNVLRAGYPGLALCTLILDAGKGAVVVLGTRYFYPEPLVFFDTNVNEEVLAGIFACLGHIFPIWLRFKGGKGVATAFGTLIAINPIIALLGFLTWLIVAIIFKFSSLAAIIATIMLPIYIFLPQPSILWYMVALCMIILVKHQKNIVRLYKNQETKIRFKAGKK